MSGGKKGHKDNEGRVKGQSVGSADGSRWECGRGSERALHPPGKQGEASQERKHRLKLKHE